MADRSNLGTPAKAPRAPGDRPSSGLRMDEVQDGTSSKTGYVHQGDKPGWSRDRGRNSRPQARNRGW